MCGIVGVVDVRGQGRLPSAQVFDAMTDALARRGPDGRGTWRDAHVALGHRRLAIIETSSAGAQPMLAHDERYVLSFNGEIYNYLALRAQLQALGHSFRTRSDSEVILEGYRAWGDDVVQRLNGIFAFAVWDREERKLLLARDPIGIKPLYVHEAQGVLRFGSELKALLADPAVERVVDGRAIDAFLSLAYVPSPLSPFVGMTSLPPGHIRSIDVARGTDVTRQTWKPTVSERPLRLADALEAVQDQLKRSVELQMVADVPLGAFLSGGLDSASVVAEMVRLSPRVLTFSAGFADKSFDERSGAEATARTLKTHHREFEIALDLERAVLDVASTNDDLLADASLLAVDALCRVTREHVTVALSGDGADEILAGYGTYAATYLARAWRRAPRRLRGVASKAAERLPPSTDRYNVRDFALRFLRGAEQGPGRDFASWRIYLDDEMKRQGKRSCAEFDAVGAYAAAMPSDRSMTLLKRMLVADLTSYLPSDMLVKVDRASMRHGLEVRVPFLDVDFVDLALSLPSSLLLSPTGEKKKVLRRHVAQRVSVECATRKKRGFNVPVGAALRGPLYPLLLDAVRAEPFRSDGPLDVQVVERWAAEHRAGTADHGYPLYAILVLALWWQRFATGAATAA